MLGRQRIDQRGHAGRRHLDQAEFRPEGRFADELGVDRDEFGFREFAAMTASSSAWVGNDMHEMSSING